MPRIALMLALALLAGAADARSPDNADPALALVRGAARR